MYCFCIAANVTVAGGAGWAQSPSRPGEGGSVPAANSVPGAVDPGVIPAVAGPGGMNPVNPADPTLSWAWGLRASLYATDNALLQPDSAKGSGTVTEVSPYVRAVIDRERTKAAFSYSLRALHRTGTGSSNEVRHDLRAFGDTAVAGDYLRFSGKALMFDSNRGSYLSNTSDASTTVPGQRYQYKYLEASPYVAGRVGNDLAVYEARLRGAYTDDGLYGVKIYDTGVGGSLRSLDRSGQFGWVLSGQAMNRRFDSAFDFGSAYFTAGMVAGPSRDLRLGLSANYSRVDIVLDDAGRNSGWGPGVSLDWRPSGTSTVSLSAVREYYATTGAAIARHTSETWAVGLSGYRALSSVRPSSLLYYDPSEVFGASGAGASSSRVLQALMNQGLLNPTGTLLAPGTLVSAQTLDKSLVASLGGSGLRNSLLLTLYAIDRTPVRLSADALAVGTLFSSAISTRQTGATLTYLRQLDPRLSLVAKVGTTETRSENPGGKARLTGLALGVQTSFSRNLFGTAEIRKNRQRVESGGAVDYDERAVFVSLVYRH